ERYADALGQYEAMAAVNGLRAEADPASVTTRRDLAFSWLQVAETHAALGTSDSASVVADRALRIYEDLASEYPTITDFQRDLASTHVLIAGILAPADAAV